MAKEWYLMTSDRIGDGFSEVLESDAAVTVSVYPGDLSESSEVRCVIQGNTADTRTKSVERVGLFPCGTVRAGMYVLFENSYWLVSSYPGSNGIYEKAILSLCQMKLKWQDEAGNILERWAHIVPHSSHYRIWLPDDDGAATLDRKRIFLDRDAKDPKKVYEVTRRDDALYLFGENHGGILGFIAEQTERNAGEDRPDLGICDYIAPAPPLPDADETTKLTAVISGGTTLRCGRAKSWTVSFQDAGGNAVEDQPFYWNVISGFDLSQTVSGNRIQIKTDQEPLIGESFLLQVVGVTVLAELSVNITEGF